jgi:hypothetical protein
MFASIMKSVSIAQEYRWATTFVAMALLFNPVVSVPRSTGALFFLMIFVCLASFTISLGAWKTRQTELSPVNA